MSDNLWSEEFPSLVIFASLSLFGLPIWASIVSTQISLLHNNKTLSCCTRYPKLGFSGDIDPKITVYFVCVHLFLPVFFFSSTIFYF